MKQKKAFYQKSGFRFLVLFILVGVISWQIAPLLQPLAQKRLEAFLAENTESLTDGIKTTRIIPADADLGAYLAGYVAQANKDPKAVEVYYEKVYATDPENKDVEMDLFNTYLLNGTIEKAIPLAQKIMTTDADNLFSKYVVLIHLMKQGKYQEALDLMNTPHFHTKEMQLFCYFKVWCYAGLQNEEKAFEALRSVPVSAQLGLHKYHKALLLDYFGHKTEAMDIYRTITPNNISSINTIVSVGAAFEGTPEWAVGGTLYEQYRQLFLEQPVFYVAVSQLKNPLIETPLQAIGDIFYTVSNALAANKYNRLALMLNHVGAFADEKSNLIKITGAELFQKLEMHQQANETYATIEPMSDFIRYRMAMNEMVLKNPQAAIRLFSSINKDELKSPRVQYMLGLSHLQMKQYSEALSYFNQAIEQYKATQKYVSIPPILLFQAQIYQEQKKMPEMFDKLEEALLFDEENADTLNFLGYELINQDKDPVRGLNLVQQAFHQKPHDLYIMDSLAWGYFKTGNYPEALRYAEMVVNKMSGNALANAHLGDIYHAMGRYREAESQYRKALTAKQDITPQLETEIHQKLNALIEK